LPTKYDAEGLQVPLLKHILPGYLLYLTEYPSSLLSMEKIGFIIPFENGFELLEKNINTLKNHSTLLETL